MKAGIIAAGEGSRFRRAGIAAPKPLIKVGGMTLIERTVRALVAAGASEIVLIVNDGGGAIIDHVRGLGIAAPLRFIRKTTPGSFASMMEIARVCGGAPFLLTTVDTIAGQADMTGFARRFADAAPDVLLARTAFIDDETPLHIAADGAGHVTALGANAAGAGFATAGVYGFGVAVLAHGEEAERAGVVRLRDFLAMLLARGLRIESYCFAEAIDVDRPQDIAVAETFLGTPMAARCA